MKKLFFVLVMAVLSANLAMGQYLVSGTVSGHDGSPLPGARVQLDGKTTSTSINGQFSLSEISTGKHSLLVNFIGYEQYLSEITVYNNLTVNIVMKETSILKGEVTVAAVRAKKTDPIAYTEITREEIRSNNFGQDIPYLLNQTPGLVISSDAGTGIGYTSMRLRGTDLTRINVTVNGIPLNDAESQGVFWVNMPDFASSLNQVQIQRGVGTSTNGAAAFGGSINFSTLDGPRQKEVTVDNGYGTFNTLRNSVQIQTGLLNNNFAFDMRLSNITSDGFVDRAFSDLKSFYFAGGYYGDATTLRFVTFSGKERTYQAWNGVPKVKLDNDQVGMEKLVIMDGWSAAEADNLYASDARTFNRYLYDNQTDNYQQDHYQIHFSHKPLPHLLLNAALHYTKGKGYYESLKYNERFTKYNLPYSSMVVDGETITRTDLIARKWLDNDFYGITASGIYQYANLHLVVGGGWNQYDGDHYGNVIWSAYSAGLPENYRWYFNAGTKKDLNYFSKITYEVLPGASIYTDLQMRHVSYEIEGFHDDQRDLTRSSTYDFFNPKFGVNLELPSGIRAYASVAVANREPSRSNFRDADENEPQPEKLWDYEAGIDVAGDKWAIQLNGFFMDYKDQLVLTGKINNVGAYIMDNVSDSYRSGIELSGQLKLSQNLIWGANIVASQNIIKNFTEFVDVWDDGSQQENHLGTTDIAFSPNLTFASRIEAQPLPGLRASLSSRYVGNQFIDNTSNSDRQLDAYIVNDLAFRYVIKSNRFPLIELGFQVNNLLDEKYISNAWVYSYIYDNERDVLDGYFPQAGRHYMANLILRF
jgi:iron complex outermembrane recepter protein